ncbi:methyltransferase, FxLD system [Streptosporangium sp. NPDC001681]|uniref:methyltransferase, FxLD system n=1 Tax=Streptosporangium sp. NPDC001681 TaxID=3154395 RepID=UPI0033189EF3
MTERPATPATIREDAITEENARALREAMVAELRQCDAITSESVAAAMSTVPRHKFALDEPLDAAYSADRALVIKRDEDGTAISSLSAAHIQAVMLEQAGVEPGMRVLEVGSGGYNAALLAELVGEEGKVTSVDIDPEIVCRARDCLNAAGYAQVEVVTADAENGVPKGAPYDRILVTAGSWDLPPAWIDQLAKNGRIVVPLRLRGLTRSIAFDRVDDGLVSDSYRLAGFVPMQGEGAFNECLVRLEDGVALRIDDTSQRFDVGALREALHAPKVERWSGAAFDLPDELELFLMSSIPHPAMLHVGSEHIDSGRFNPAAGRGVPTLIHGGSFAYRIKRDNPQTGGFESGVIAHGPQAEEAAEQYVELLRRWADHHRRRGAARITYLPATAGALAPARGVVLKRHGAVTISWA